MSGGAGKPITVGHLIVLFNRIRNIFLSYDYDDRRSRNDMFKFLLSENRMTARESKLALVLFVQYKFLWSFERSKWKIPLIRVDDRKNVDFSVKETLFKSVTRIGTMMDVVINDRPVSAPQGRGLKVFLNKPKYGYQDGERMLKFFFKNVSPSLFVSRLKIPKDSDRYFSKGPRLEQDVNGELKKFEKSETQDVKDLRRSIKAEIYGQDSDPDGALDKKPWKQVSGGGQFPATKRHPSKKWPQSKLKH